MKIKQNSLNYLVLTTSFSFLLCATACTTPGKTTGIGAAAGGVLGAGLGAIVGSQAGNAGAGVAVGATAGAATGALIANAVEGHNEQLASRDETIERQSQKIRMQDSQIQELRKISADDNSIKGRLGNSSKNWRLPTRQEIESKIPLRSASNQRTYPKAQSFAATHEVARTIISEKSIEESQSDSAMAERFNRQKTVGRTKAVEHNTYAAAATHQEPNVDAEHLEPVIDSKLERKDNVAAYVTQPDQNKIQEKTIINQVNAVEPTLPEVQAAVEPTTTTATTSALNLSATSPECKQAADEAKLSNQADESSDKLFHLRRALRLCPSESNLHVMLGELYIKLNRQNDAEFEFKEALKLDSLNVQAQQNLENLTKAGSKF